MTKSHLSLKPTINFEVSFQIISYIIIKTNYFIRFKQTSEPQKGDEKN